MEDDFLLQKTKELFDFAPPSSLRQSLHAVLFDYLSHIKHEPPANFQSVVSDFYFLMNFLEGAKVVREN
jgi:hypothetical protein